jgi:hypothetical protein
MKPKFQRRQSRAAKWAMNTGGFALVLLCASAFAHRFVNLATADFFRLSLLCGVLALIAVALAAIGYRDLWNVGAKAGGEATSGLLFALLALAPIAWFTFKAQTLPALYDISTDVEDPPLFSQATLTTRAEDNHLDALPAETVRLQEEVYPGVTARRYNDPADTVAQAVFKLMEERGWPQLAIAGTPGTSAEVTIDTRTRSAWLGLHYSMIIRLTDEDASTFVDMRSASHYGTHDFGANAARIEAFFRDLDLAVATQAK